MAITFFLAVQICSSQLFYFFIIGEIVLTIVKVELFKNKYLYLYRTKLFFQ